MRAMEMGINHDPRRVGVAIRSIELQGSGYRLAIGYDSPRLADGFNNAEPEERQCWTTGAAPLPRTALAPFDGPFEVLIEVVCTAKYPLVEEAAAPEPLRVVA